MTTIHTLVLIAHVMIGAAIIGLVLLQRGKGAEAGAAFGSGASGTVFGARGSANFLSRSTAVLATLFFVTSLSLAYLGAQRPPEQSLLDSAPTETAAPAAEGQESAVDATAATPAGGPAADPVAPEGVPALPAAPAPAATGGEAEAPALPEGSRP